MRFSSELRTQDAADRLECFMLRELLRDDSKKWLDSGLDRVAKSLSDNSARQAARRRAIAASWHNFLVQSRSNIQSNSFGGYEVVDMHRKAGTFENLAVSKRRLGRAVADLWEFANAGQAGATEQRLKRIADYWGMSYSAYGFGESGKYLRPDDASYAIVPTATSHMPAPASLWLAGWEQQAERLPSQP
jgi:hypothetical protein